MRKLVTTLAQIRCIEANFTGGDIAWSADGSKIYATCTNNVKEIDLSNNLETRCIGGSEDRGRVTALALDENRQRLFVAYNSGLICEYSINVETFGNLVRSWKPMHSAPILIMMFNPDYSLFATASSDHNIKVWNVHSQTQVHYFAGAAVVTSLLFSNNDFLFAGYMDGKIRMFDLDEKSTEKVIAEWSTHSSHISAICEHSDPRKIVCFSRDQTYTIIDIKTTKALSTLPVFEATECAVIVNGKAFTVGEKGFISEWNVDIAQKKKSKELVKHALRNIQYNAKVDKFLVTTEEEIVLLISSTNFEVNRQIVGFHDEIFSIALAGTEPGYLVVAANSSQLRVYDRTSWDCRLLNGHTSSVLCVKSASWDLRTIASCSKDNFLILWKLDEETKEIKPVAIGSGHTASVSSLAFSHSDKPAFILTASSDTTLKLWNLKKLAKSKAASSIEECEKIACSSTIVAHQKDITAVDCAPNDGLCLTASMDKTAKIWKIDTSKMQLGIAGTLTGHKRGIWDARFSPNAQKVATCSGDQSIKLWNVEDCSCLHTLSGHTFTVLKVEWINNGSQLLSADSGGVLKIWRLDTTGGEAETTVEAHDDKIWALNASADQSEYFTAGSDGKILIWKDVSEEKREEEDAVRREKVLQEQTLVNLLEQDRFFDALEFALGLNRPFCALKVVDELVMRDMIFDAIQRLPIDKIPILLDFAAQWNTNAKTAMSAQQVLNSVLRSLSPNEVLALPNIATTVEAFLPYTKRHVERLNKARQDAALLDYTVAQMRIL